MGVANNELIFYPSEPAPASFKKLGRGCWKIAANTGNGDSDSTANTHEGLISTNAKDWFRVTLDIGVITLYTTTLFVSDDPKSDLDIVQVPEEILPLYARHKEAEPSKQIEKDENAPAVSMSDYF